jgi:predicted dehydrogenase
MLVHQKVPGVRLVAVCDLNEKRLGLAVEAAGSPGVQTYRDYRKLLENPDIDAVIVATNDHWHVLTTVHACQAGKDVYLEKPLGTSIAEGRAAVEAARKYERIVQIGTQQRTWEHYVQAAEIVHSGELGEISEVKVWDYENYYPGFGAPPNADPPEEFGREYWDFWVGPSPQVPYNPNRFLHHYWFFDYGGGWQVDWGVHHYDIVHWYMQVKAPLAATAVGGFRCFEETNSEWPDTFSAICEYGPGPAAKKGFVLQYTFRGGCRQAPTYSAAHGKIFFGSNASLAIDRSGYTLTSEFPGTTKSPQVIKKVESKGTDPTLAHAQEFIRAVRERKWPSADIEKGHYATNPGHLMNIAWKVGRQIWWDPEREEVIEDPEAQALVSKVYRAPWRLEV